MYKPEHLIKRKVTPSDIDSVKYRRKKLQTKATDPDLLHRCETLWLNLSDFRAQYARGVRFAYGDQWGDIITVNGQQMTYRKYLMNTGNVVIQTNQIKNRVDTIAGVVVKEKAEPVCHALDRDEQQFGELVTTALQANCDKNVISTLYIKWVKDLCLGGLAAAYEAYDDHSGPDRRLDSWTQYINPNTLILEGDTVDPRGWDMSIIGRFFYGSYQDICAQFAHSPEDYAILSHIYANASDPSKIERVRNYGDQYEDGDLLFMRSFDTSRCYVCEVWTKETKAKIRLHDQSEGTEEIIDADDYSYRKEVKAENERRKRLAAAAGWSEEETNSVLILGDGYGSTEEERNGFFVDTYWYCRFMAPDGTILWEGESPYPGRTHPFTLCIFPFTNGKIVGYMNDAIDHNVAMNRAVVLHDWLLRTQAKGVTVVPKKIVPDDVSYKEFARSWTSIDDMVFIDMEPGQEGLMPKVFFGAAQNFDVSSLIATYTRLMDAGSPVNGALQGKTPTSGTSGTLYAQMATNASTPIAALLEDFHKFIEGILNKKMKNIVKFYSPDRFAQIAGHIDSIYDMSTLNLNEVGDLEYDLKVKESSNTPVFRAVINQDAKEFLLNGLIDFEEYLTIADVPYADKILQGRQARQAEVEAAQQAGVTPGAVTEAVPGAAAPPAAGLPVGV